MILDHSTSASGSIRGEIQDALGERDDATAEKQRQQMAKGEGDGDNDGHAQGEVIKKEHLGYLIERVDEQSLQM